MLLMSFMLQIWMKLMVLMLLMMSNLTIMTMMMILMMIRPGEGGTFCWLASQLAGWLAALSALSTLSALFVKSRIRRKKSDPPPFCNFLPCLPEPSRKVYIPVFQGAGDWKINLFLWIYFFLFFWKTRKTREIVSLEIGANRQVRPRAAISKLGLGKNLKTIWLGRKWSLDHRTCDQSCPGLKKKVFKSHLLL